MGISATGSGAGVGSDRGDVGTTFGVRLVEGLGAKAMVEDAVDGPVCGLLTGSAGAMPGWSTTSALTVGELFPVPTATLPELLILTGDLAALGTPKRNPSTPPAHE
jgi:hypothetical protein